MLMVGTSAVELEEAAWRAGSRKPGRYMAPRGGKARCLGEHNEAKTETEPGTGGCGDGGRDGGDDGGGGGGEGECGGGG